MYQSAPQSAAFNDALTARIRSSVDVPALQRAFQTLAARHAVLRTTFPILNGEPVQAVHDDSSVFFEVTDAQDGHGTRCASKWRGSNTDTFLLI